MSRSRSLTPVSDKLILASASPRRANILSAHGVPFEVLATAAPEVSIPEAPERTVLDNARAKLVAARQALARAGRNDFRAVLAADTIVWFNNRIYGKPRDLAEAAEFLRELSGRTHTVFTGVAYTDGDGEIAVACERSEVTFRELDEKAIAEYVKRVRPVDRAGAYDIDESGDLIVASYVGSYENIMGLPYGLLEKLGVVPKEV